MHKNVPRFVATAPSQTLIAPDVQLDRPILSIAVPTYKRFDLLIETLGSIFSLEFDFPVEVLVVDNDPTQHDLAISEMFRYAHRDFTYYKNNENLGMFGNWNQCLALAKGKYITILHDDDILLPEFANQMNSLLSTRYLEEKIVAFSVGMMDLRPNRPTDGSSGPGKWLSLVRKLHSKHQAEKGKAELFFANPFCGTLGIVMDRSVALSLGGFDKEWYPIGDYEFWCRWACQVSDIPLIEKQVGLYRMQQNESLRPDVREKFVTESSALRRRLIEDKFVPSWFKYIVGYTASVQNRSIAIDWRTEDEPDPVFFRSVSVRLWHKAVNLVCYFVRKMG